MKKIFFIFALLVSVFAQAQIDKVVPSRPSPPRLVNDFTGTLTSQQIDALEKKLVAYDDSTSNQVAVVLLPTLTDDKSGATYEDEEVALKILRDWGVGNKDKNNGIVLLIAKKEHKIRIEVGYGLEGAIPDITAKHIIEEEIVPNFKQDNYYRGIDEGTDAIIKAAAGEYKAPEGYGSKKSKGIPVSTIIFIIIMLFVIFGAGGSSGGGMMSRRGYRGWWGPTIWTGGGSGGGGGWSGGGGGGFGGFGGGSGGGGGASGSW